MSSNAPVGQASIEVTESCSVISLRGEVDASLIAVLHEICATAERHAMPVVIDCHDLKFMDSSGVAFVARLATRLPDRVAIEGATPSLHFLLDVTGLADRVHMS